MPDMTNRSFERVANLPYPPEFKNVEEIRSYLLALRQSLVLNAYAQIEDFGNYGAPITTEKIANGAITGTKISAGAIDESAISDSAITAAKIAVGAVTTAKIAANAITTEKIANAAITASLIGDDYKILEIVNSLPSAGNAGRIVYLTSDNKIYRDNGTEWKPLILPADVYAHLGGEGVSQITSTQISDSAITTPKIAAGSVITDHLVAGAVTSDIIAANAVIASKIAAGAIYSDHLAAGAVTTPKIAAGAVISEKIAAKAITAEKLVVAPFTDNLILNPSFESDGGWALVEGSGTATYTTIDKTEGERSLLISPRYVAYGCRAIPLVPGDTYIVRIKLRGTSATSAGLYLRMNEKTAYPNGDYVTASLRDSFTNFVANGAVPDTWTTYQFTYTVPANRYWGSFSVYNWGGGPTGGIYIDEAEVRKQLGSWHLEDASISTDKIAAGAITADKISVNSLSAISADMGILTAGKIQVGNIEINANTERILMGAASGPTTGTGVFIGKDGTDYELRCGDPTGQMMHWDGTTLKIYYNGHDIDAQQLEQGAARARMYINWEGLFMGRLIENQTGYLYGSTSYQLKSYYQGGYPPVWYLGFQGDATGGGGGTGEECFTGDTMILMANGKEKRIDKVMVGDQVLTRQSPTDSSLVRARVIAVKKHNPPKSIRLIGPLKITGEHLIYVNGAFVPARDARVGDLLLNLRNELVPIDRIEIITENSEYVYNLEVEVYKTFFANGIYVHNSKEPAG